jgi:dTDP-4-amino-4,6-dideoxygalactose transaminase
MGVETRIHYPIPIHLQASASYLGYKVGDFPMAEEYAATMLSLPIYPELEDPDIKYIVDVIAGYMRGVL